MNKITLFLGLFLAMASPALAQAPFNITQDRISFGKPGDSANKIIEANVSKSGTSTNPKLRFNFGTSIWEYSNNGSTFSSFASSGFTNPMTTSGDMIYGGASGVGTRLPVGSNGQMLQLVAGIPTWTPTPTPAPTPNAGTVTSVAASVPSIFSISGSPITTSGTLTMTYSGTALPIANGGTNNSSLGVTAGGVTYADGSKLQTSAAGTSGQILTSNGASAPGWSSNLANSFFSPVAQVFTSSGTYNPTYVFVVSSANATAGATYTNNSVSFTVQQTIASGLVLYASGASVPLTSGTLTKASGTGDATITFSAEKPPLYSVWTVCGPGGGGGGSGSGGGTGGQGTATSLGSLASCTGGLGGSEDSGSATGAGAQAGGVCTLSNVIKIKSTQGATGAPMATAATSASGGGSGGSSPLGGSGAGGINNTAAGSSSANAPLPGIPNSCSGGGGVGSSGTVIGASGGSAGGYSEFIYTSPATQTVTISSGGAGGTAGTSGSVAAAGGSGYGVGVDHYQ